MAGSGKSTLIQRLITSIDDPQRHAYVVNLDPAVLGPLNYPAHVDIRQTVDYRKVMEEYTLGPNGAIITCLNLFATRIHELVHLIERRVEATDGALEFVIVDTPGQIEAFSWSASGEVITEALRLGFPTVLLFVADGLRCVQSATTFMSNMLYACSMMFRARIPLLVAFNKSDTCDLSVLSTWMKDAFAFHDALQAGESRSGGVRPDTDGEYMLELTHSMSLLLDSFYENLENVSVSAMSGDGVDDLFEKVRGLREEYDAMRKEWERQESEKKEKEKEKELEKVREDLKEEREELGLEDLKDERDPKDADELTEQDMRKMKL
eukprot:TRINITY_DN551_c0_g1_i2.p1 TRINITY_DN551_c0_g1~~TRINITY_DN551_c0_g1_i2.p1  ORF type:complete len:368 (+),score=111.11 TRINITY_DN551_c0_g1_i2:140-1105(+)